MSVQFLEDIPICLPQTRLVPGVASLPIAEIYISPEQKIRLRWLSINFLSFGKYASFNTLNSAMTLVNVGLYHGSFDNLQQFSGTPLIYIGRNSPGISSLNHFKYKDFTAPGYYSVLVVNNSTICDIDVIVTGALRVYGT